MDLKLVIFDVDGTLVDSQAKILGAMQHAFDSAGLVLPSREEVLAGVGLSLPILIARLMPDESPETHAKLVVGYKEAFFLQRQKGGLSPLYPGIREMLDRLAGIDHLLMGIATGKSRRGLTALLDGLDMASRFVSTQVADDHPSKPNPSMLLTALSETGMAPEQAVMIGDTEFDMDMARAARIRPIGVSWGYHTPDALAPAPVAQNATALEAMIHEMLEI